MPVEGRLPKARHACASRSWRALVISVASIGAATWLAGCSGTLNTSDLFPNSTAPPPTAMATAALPAPAAPGLGNGGVKVGLILPLSASGNAGTAGQAMRNAAEMALAEF